MPGGVYKPTRCVGCGYDLRHLTSDRCPECGSFVAWQPIHLRDRVSLEIASAALGEALIEHQAVHGMDGLSGVMTHLAGGSHGHAEVWVPQPQHDQALDTLDAAGLAVGLPIVDRHEQACPYCTGDLDHSSAACPACGITFTWVDVEAAVESPDDDANAGLIGEDNADQLSPVFLIGGVIAAGLLLGGIVLTKVSSSSMTSCWMFGAIPVVLLVSGVLSLRPVEAPGDDARLR